MGNAISAEKTQMMKNILKRKRLNPFLKEIFKVPLTIVTAPAGYGKTTLVKEFLTTNSVKVSWAQFTHMNKDIHYFWSNFTSLFISPHDDISQKLLHLGFPTDVSLYHNVFNIIKNTCDDVMKHIIVLDDYHQISHQKIDTFIETLAREKINNLHIVIMTRHDPGFNLIDLSLKGLVSIISQNELEFTSEEIQEYAKLCKCKVSFDVAKKIQKTTEGWISAIYLFLLEYRQSGKIGDTINIDSLMEKTVYQQFDEATQYLLALLSIPDSFTKEQIEYVTENTQNLKRIDKFYETNAFIKYDLDHNVYRMHSLFREFLKQKLKELSDTQTKQFYLRISQWHFENREFMLGFKYLCDCKEYERLLKAVQKYGVNEIIITHKSAMITCFDHIPKTILYKFPVANFIYIIRLITFNEQKKAIYLLEQFKQYIDISHLTNDKKRKILGEIAFIKSIASFNNLTQMVKYHKTAYELLDEGTSIGNQENPFTFGSSSLLYLYYKDKGNLQNTVNYFKETIHYYRHITHGCGTGSEYAFCAEYFYACGKLIEAERMAKKAIEEAKIKNQVGIILVASLVLIRFNIFNGNVYKVLTIFKQIEELVKNASQPVYSTTLDICKSYIYYLFKDYDKIPQWIREGDMSKSKVYSQSEGIIYILYAQSLLLKEDYVQLEILCDRMKTIFDKYTYQLGYMYNYIYDAVAKYKLYGIELAKPLILSALDIGKSDNIIMLFVDNYEFISDIVLSIEKEGCFDKNYINRIREYYTVYEKGKRKIRREYKTRIKNPSLTNREKEILSLISQKKTNKQIAEELFITEATVKKSASNIYKKLNVKGRKEALIAARNFDLN